MTTVIEHGTLSGHKYRGCKCLACYNAAAEYQVRRHRQMGYGTWKPLVDAAPAREHIEALHARGMTWDQIAADAGVDVEYLRRLRMNLGSQRRTERMRPERAETILAVQYRTVAPAPQATIPAVGTVRRLRALRAHGWPMGDLAARASVARHTIGIIVGGRQASVFAVTAERVAELYEDLHGLDPRRFGVRQAIADQMVRRARAADWAPPRAWDGLDIDDPTAEPAPTRACSYQVSAKGDRQRAIVENTAELVTHGLTREAIADRLGTTWDNVRAAHARAGVPLPEPAS